jgi:conjugal transfer pilin signal peptidase TrbI
LNLKASLRKPIEIGAQRRVLKNSIASFKVGNCIIVMAAIALIWFLQANYKIVINRSESLPIHAVLIQKGKLPTKLDQIFVFKLQNNPAYNFAEVNFIKRAAGFVGDKIEVVNQDFYINHKFTYKFIGTAKTLGLKGETLNPLSAQIIPQHKFFAYTPHPDSYDSRYQQIGLIDEKDIIGSAIFAF